MGNLCARKEPGISPEDATLKNEIKTGDVLLFQGARFLSQLVMCGTNSSFSHTGVAIVYDDGVYVCHATPNPGKLPSRGSTDVKNGIMITRLEDELSSGWYTDCMTRSLLKELGPEEGVQLKGFAEKNIGTPYEDDMAELTLAGVDCFCCGVDICHVNRCCCCSSKSDEDRSKTIFCSEWVMKCYIEIGVLNKKKDLNEAQERKLGELKRRVTHEFAPGDFEDGSGSTFDELQVFGESRRIEIPKKVKVGRFKACCNFDI